MRIFITTIPDELEPYQAAAVGIVRELGHEPVLRDPAARRGLEPVAACGRQIALADMVLAIVGWRRGPVPSVALGGDDLRPWTYWEVNGAFAHTVPVVALLAGETLVPEFAAEVPEARAVMADLRGAVFDNEAEFHRLARTALSEAERGGDPPKTAAGMTLRRFPPPELPVHPYPLLLPYSHPDLMAGRDDDLEDLRRTLSRPVTIIGLHAASGTGKSSLLAAGLVPTLRAEGWPVAFVRHPTEPGVVTRLLADLVEGEEAHGLVDRSLTSDVHPGDSQAATSLVDRLAAIRRLADGAPPILVIDQFEDLLKDDAETARATLGICLAASAQRLPGLDGPPCRWLLAYRQEFYGKLVEWLEDVLRDARRLSPI